MQKPAVKNATNGSPRTASGHGVVVQGRQSARISDGGGGNSPNGGSATRNGNSRGANGNGDKNARPEKPWWEKIGGDPRVTAATLHGIADSFWNDDRERQFQQARKEAARVARQGVGAGGRAGADLGNGTKSSRQVSNGGNGNRNSNGRGTRNGNGGAKSTTRQPIKGTSRANGRGRA
jgi:hypothetical protein